MEGGEAKWEASWSVGRVDVDMRLGWARVLNRVFT